MDVQDFRQVGSLLKPHGIRGEFVVFLESDFPDWVAERETLYAEIDGTMEAWKVVSSRLRNKKLIMAVEQLPTRNDVEARINTPLFVPEEDARKLITDPDYFYNSDLVGLSMTHALSDTVFGKVTTVVEMPAQNLLEVERPDGRVFLFPFTKALVKEVNTDQGYIQVLMPEGMLEANEEEEEKVAESPETGASEN